MKKDFSKRVFVSITGCTEQHWKDKLKEINKFKIPKVALFLTRWNKKQKQKIYKALLKSKIKEIPLVHLRHDMLKDEVKFLAKNFKTKYFTIHEESFKIMHKWKGFYKKLFLEMDYNNFVSKSVNVNKIGGFCIDLAHFKADEEKWSKEFEYIIKRRNVTRYFACNHISGYSPEKNRDKHTVESAKDFNYLTSLPKFLFGKVLAVEIDNNIAQQLKFKKYIVRLLNRRFDK